MEKVIDDFNCTKHVVYLGESEFSTWQLFIYAKAYSGQVKTSKVTVGDETTVLEKVLIGGDLIRIKHSEIDAYLCASVCFKDDNPEVYFRKYHGEHETEINNLDTIWEICSDRRIYQGEGIRPHSPTVVLKHLNSGRLLTIEAATGKCNLGPVNLNPNNTDIICTTRFEPLQLKVNTLKSNLSYKIACQVSNSGDGNTEVMYLSQGDSILTKDDLENKPESIQLSKDLLFVPLEDHFYDETRIRAEFHLENKVDEAFVIETVDESEK